MEAAASQDRSKEIEFWDNVSKKEEAWILETPKKEIIEKIKSGVHWWDLHWWEEMIGEVRGKKILDIGCGNTYFVTYWELTGNEAYGSDFSPGTIAANKLLHKKLGLKENFYVSSSEKIEASDASLDIVHMRWVIHHIPPELQDRSMQEIRRVLKPGGKLIVFETNYGYPFRWIVQTPMLRQLNIFRKYAIKKGVLDPEEKALTNKGYIDLIKRNGFVIEKIGYEINFFFYPVSIMTKNESVRKFVKGIDEAIKKIIPTAFSKDIKIVASNP